MRKQLSKSDIAELNSMIESRFHRSDFFHKKDRIIVEDASDKRVIFKDGFPFFFYENDSLVPTLKLLLKDRLLKTIVVDMGAVKFVTNGADIMRPGITSVEHGIEKDDFVVILDETHNKPLAVGQAMFSKEEIDSMSEGKVIKNLHFVGDEIWSFA